MCPFDYTSVAGSGKSGPINRLTTSHVVTPTDFKSVHNRYVIEYIFVLSLCFFKFSVGKGAFDIEMSRSSSCCSCNMYSYIKDILIVLPPTYQNLEIPECNSGGMSNWSVFPEGKKVFGAKQMVRYGKFG